MVEACVSGSRAASGPLGAVLLGTAFPRGDARAQALWGRVREVFAAGF